MKNEKLSFNQFLNYFPEIELPVNLNEETLSIFNKENPPIPKQFIEEFISDFDHSESDEFTEYIPCFRIPGTESFIAIVYWKAQLMNYEYHLACYDLKGNFITGKVIGGMISNGDSIIKTVSTIDPDWIIHVVSGKDDLQGEDYAAENSKVYTLELLSTGDIIFSLNEDEFSL